MKVITLEDAFRQTILTSPAFGIEADWHVIERRGMVYAGAIRTFGSGRLPENRISRVDVQLEDHTCYLLAIEIASMFRGIGIGLDLYRQVEQFARLAGCSEVRQTAVGTTPSGETRDSYLARNLGYVLDPDGVETVKKLGLQSRVTHDLSDS